MFDLEGVYIRRWVDGCMDPKHINYQLVVYIYMPLSVTLRVTFYLGGAIWHEDIVRFLIRS